MSRGKEFNMHRFHFTLTLIAMLAGCAATTEKVPTELVSGKADDSLEYVDQGPVTFDQEVNFSLAPNMVNTFSLELDTDSEISLKTTSTDRLDTLLYVLQGEDEVAMNDDSDGLLAALTVPLSAGSYTIVVAGYQHSQEGSVGLVASGGASDPGPVDDGFELARDVNLHHVEFDETTAIPESFERQDAGFVRLGSPEWWQRWSGGHTQSFNWSLGTDFGKRCGQASAIRLAAIYADPEGKEAFDALAEGSGWSGTMYNWTEDISEGGRASFSPASMWAWRTSAVKFINVVHPDGSCDLPTLQLVKDFSETCLSRAENSDGEIQGCRASAR